MIFIYAKEPATNNWIKLENGELTDISLTYTFADIRNIEKKISTYSKTITLPSTHVNDKFFESAYMITADLYFDHRKSIEIRVESDGDFIMVGKMYLMAVNWQPSTRYEVLLVGNNADLFTKLGNKTIREIFEDIGTHTYNYNTATINANTFANPQDYAIVPVDNAYKYDINGSGDLEIDYQNLIPAIRVNRLLEILFNYAGYDIDSTSVIYDNNYKELRYLYLLGHSKFLEFLPSETYIRCLIKRSSNLTVPFSLTTLFFDFNFQGDVEVYDNLNIYNPTTYLLTISNKQIKYNVYLKGMIEIDYFVPGVSTMAFVSAFNAENKYDVIVKTYIGGITGTLIVNTIIQKKATIISVNTYLPGINIVKVSIPLNDGFEANLFSNFTNQNIFFRLQHVYSGVSGVIALTTQLPVQNLIIETPSFVKITESKKMFNNTYNALSLFDADTKAADFIKSYLKSFNLFLIQERTEEDKLKIVDYENFFIQTPVISLDSGLHAGKVNFNNKRIVYNHDYQASEISFKWAEEKDYYIEQHKKITGQLYGERTFKNDNEVSKNKIDNQSLMCTIPIVFEGVPRNSLHLFENNQKKQNNDFKNRIVLLNGLINVPFNLKIIQNNTVFATINGKFPMFCHYFINVAESAYSTIWQPINLPQFNLNYSFPTVNWYSYALIANTTNNDIYNKYFRKYVGNFTSKESRIYQCEMLIDSTLRNILPLRNIFYFDGSNFILNKINDFGTFGKKYKVEFVRVVDLGELPPDEVEIDITNLPENSNLRLGGEPTNPSVNNEPILISNAKMFVDVPSLLGSPASLTLIKKIPISVFVLIIQDFDDVATIALNGNVIWIGTLAAPLKVVTIPIDLELNTDDYTISLSTPASVGMAEIILTHYHIIN